MNTLLRILYTCLVLVCVVSVPSRGLAQIQRYNATAENDYGLVYTLPQTEYIVTLTTLREHFRPGKLAPWAAKYLGKAAEAQEQDHYQILDIRVKVIGVPDSTKRYHISFDKKSIAPFVALTAQGILYSINGSKEPEAEAAFKVPSYPKPDEAMPGFPREYSLAVSESKRAELAATYLYELREHSMNIVSGEVEQMPKDGESMRLILDKLKTEEQRTLRLFYGDTVRTVAQQTFRIIPERDDMNARLLCRFSPQWGIVPNDDLSGDALYYDLRIIERSPELSPKEQAKRDKIEGIVYNLPGIAELSLRLEERPLAKERLPITQVGTIQSLNKKMLNIKEAGSTAVYFDPRSGALLRVTTE